VRPPNRAHVQRLVTGVQDEDLPHFLGGKVPAKADYAVL